MYLKPNTVWCVNLMALTQSSEAMAGDRAARIEQHDNPPPRLRRGLWCRGSAEKTEGQEDEGSEAHFLICFESSWEARGTA